MSVFLVGRDPLCFRDEFARNGKHRDQRLLERDFDPTTPVPTGRNELINQLFKLLSQSVMASLASSDDLHSTSGYDTPDHEFVSVRHGTRMSPLWICSTEDVDCICLSVHRIGIRPRC